MISAEKRKALELFAQGRRFYKLMNFIDAERAFAAALKADPSDKPSAVYLERCKHYQTNPPPEDWDGVFVMTTK
jgi:hypothetical protein